MSTEGTQFLLGKILESGQGQRDAVHIAVAPVIAAETLQVGERTGLLLDGRAGFSADHIGIVDPFLTEPVRAGQRFWLYLFPNTITSLHHLWTHPAFNDEVAATPSPIKVASEKWLRAFAESNCGSYDEMLDAAKNGGNYCFGSDIAYEDFHSDAEFWHHVEVVTGKPISERQRESASFRCAC